MARESWDFDCSKAKMQHKLGDNTVLLVQMAEGKAHYADKGKGIFFSNPKAGMIYKIHMALLSTWIVRWFMANQIFSACPSNPLCAINDFCRITKEQIKKWGKYIFLHDSTLL